MKREAKVVCIIVGLIGILCASLGFAAEANRVKASQVHYVSRYECAYPRSPALVLGLTASVALLLGHIIINAMTGCICCNKGARQSITNRAFALICFIVSWFTFILAFILFLTGAALNDRHSENNVSYGSYNCYVKKRGYFLWAAFLSLASTSLGILYYLSSTKGTSAAVGGGTNQGSNIAMGQPQFPPPNAQQQPQFPPPNAQQPVFVHEDTYNRRQLA